MSKKIYLSLIFHNHQPGGNFDFVIEEAYQKAYLPLIEAFERHPAVKAAMHFSGSLRDWLLAHQPDYYQRVIALAKRGQLEILGGAYYEPVLAMLDDDDKLGQINKMTEALIADFGLPPSGMWLAERVWEPHLARPIAQAGLEYAIVDDTHFMFAGFEDTSLHGYYITEEQSHALRILPTLKELRYRVPWNEVDDVMNYLRNVHADPETTPDLLLAMADDGEKFGLWPSTYHLCWEKGYVDRLFTALEEATDWLELTTPSSYMRRFPPLGRVYLPSASYIEMSDWSLPAEKAAELPAIREALEQEALDSWAHDPEYAELMEKAVRYLRGGFWRNYLVKYPEANHMQKRSVHLSRRIRQLPESETRTRALDHLWAAQSNCSYWHGLFGGVYLFHLRASNYAHMLEAEALLAGDTIQVEQTDFDLDGLDELVITGDPFCFVIDLERGGAIIEWDDLPSRYNLLNIMTRRRESYHAKLEEAARENRIITPGQPGWEGNPADEEVRAKESELHERLFIDWHRRGLLVDHFLSPTTNLYEFVRAQYGEDGDFVDGTYNVALQGAGTDSVSVTLNRDGKVWVDGVHQPVRVEKRFKVRHDDRELEVDYTVSNLADVTLRLRFGVEAAFGFDGGDSNYCFFKTEDEEAGEIVTHLGEIASHPDVEEYVIGSRIRGFQVEVELDDRAEVWRFPLEPITLSEAGFERIHQGVIFLHVFEFELAPGESWHTEIEFEVEPLDSDEDDDEDNDDGGGGGDGPDDSPEDPTNWARGVTKEITLEFEVEDWEDILSDTDPYIKRP